MLKKTVALGVCAISLMIGISSGHAEENVVIDMSVLDSLGAPTSAAVSSSKPLFPTVKKKTVKPKAKVKKAKKAKTVKAPEVKVEAPKPEVVAPEVKVETPKPEVVVPEVKVEAPKPEVVTPEVKVEAPKPEVVTPEIKVEAPKPEVVTPEVRVEAPKPEVVAPEVKVETPKSEVVAPEVKVETPKPEVVASEAKVETPKPEVVVPEVKTEVPKREVIISQPQANQASQTGIITFAPDQSDLNDAQKRIIDDTLASFQNPKVNKMSIISYSLSGGENVFQNKRISLNRAVNTRSYLLEKGYKNFSIKIINIEADDDRINTVSLTELKK